MCLILKEDRLEPIIAPYNIICYKKLDSDNGTQSFYYTYVKDVLNPTVNIKVEKDGSENVIYRGYHSRNEKSNRSNNRIFMIPQGTKFYIGGENNWGEDNYVSETIVMLGKNNMFNRWYFKWKYKLKSYINDKTYQPI